MTATCTAILHGFITAGGTDITAMFIEVMFGLGMQVLVFITAGLLMLIILHIGMLIIQLITAMGITIILSITVGVIMAGTLIIQMSTSIIITNGKKSIVEVQTYTEKAPEAVAW